MQPFINALSIVHACLTDTQQIFVNAGGRATIVAPADNRPRALRKKDQKVQKKRQARKGLESKDASHEMLLREAERLERAAAAEEAEVKRKREKAAELRQKAESQSKGGEEGVALAVRVKESAEQDQQMQ
ncbi:hypothetical protein ASPACDRAFT_39912 [Aspergillus aculeatus ATCC 16872]|uniref:Uncharacterized protein n=1 Tax=Aspergillus aculeatus (strain ATCC 16872 / CBS 172.66 / WB 5094) TaxID=690307 RepID=A0A1L9X291_ASPA1|nr:uncharacterized protein ASPACDRAFT_39912 [Aspergillus aculeatus ATCC 16872]OJK02605.1 hypothetical protein ASPACDRAFT_39912 [Aspergillus aculeatus ATCC 16872]